MQSGNSVDAGVHLAQHLLSKAGCVIVNGCCERMTFMGNITGNYSLYSALMIDEQSVTAISPSP